MGGFGTHVVNGIISLVISLVVTAIFSDTGRESWTRSELLAAVGIASFLSGFFTSYFAK
ncbi:MAG: hypothetical protein PPP55_12785 [Halorubrum sp.]